GRSNQSSPSSRNGSSGAAESCPLTPRTHQAWCSAISAMLWRPGAGRQEAASARTSASAAFRSWPGRDRGPSPSSRIRSSVRWLGAGAAVFGFVLVLIGNSHRVIVVMLRCTLLPGGVLGGNCGLAATGPGPPGGGGRAGPNGGPPPRG